MTLIKSLLYSVRILMLDDLHKTQSTAEADSNVSFCSYVQITMLT